MFQCNKLTTITSFKDTQHVQLKMSHLQTFSGMGLAMVVANAISTCNFTIVIAWCLYYMYLSMTSDLPWQYCSNNYNTPCEWSPGG